MTRHGIDGRCGSAQSGNFPIISDGQSISIWEVEVRGWEKVTVPAGTFDTVHLTGIRKTLTGSKGTANEDMWYAPDVKRHIKHERYAASGPYIYEHWVEELTSFELR